MRRLLIALAALALGPSAPAWAQRTAAASQASMDAVARGLVAQYQAALIRERRLADQREVDLITQYETRIRDLRTQYDRGDTNVLPQLVQARADYVASVQPIAARDSEVRQLVEGYETQLAADIEQASPEQLAALQRFADGDQEEGFRLYREESERRSAARQRAAQAAASAARRADAADARQLAYLAETMQYNGRATTADVLALWERAAELEPTNIESQISRSAYAAEIGDLSRARAAAEAAVANATAPLERIEASQQLASVAGVQGDLASARRAYEQALETARGSLSGSTQAFIIADLSLELAEVQRAQRDFAGARQSYTEGIHQARRAAEAPDGPETSEAILMLLLQELAADSSLVEAAALLDAAVDVGRRLIAEDPSVMNLILTSVVLEDLARLTEGAPDAAMMEEVIALRMRAVEADPNNIQAIMALVTAHAARAEIAEAAGDFAAVRAHYDEQVVLMDRLVSLDPSNLLNRANALGLRSGWLRFLMRQGDEAGARAGYEQLLPEIRAIVAVDPTNVDLRTQTADVFERLAGLQARTNDPRAAQASFEEAVTMRRALAAIDTSDAAASRRLTSSLNQFGLFLLHRGDRRRAEEVYREALANAESLMAAAPDHSVVLDVLFMHLGVVKATRRQADLRRALERASALRQQDMISEYVLTEIQRDLHAAVD